MIKYETKIKENRKKNKMIYFYLQIQNEYISA